MDPTLELPAEPSRWPKVVGIFSIVWGCLTMGCGGCGMAMPFVMPGMLPPEMTKDGLPPTMVVNPMLLGFQALGMIMSLFLIVAGVTTLQRKASGRTLHLLFVLVSIPMAIGGLWVQFKLMGDMKQWIAEHPDNAFAKQGQSPAGNIIGLAVGVLFGFAYPLFLLVWFGILKKNPEESQVETFRPA